MWQDTIKDFLLSRGIAFVEYEDMSKITSMRCGGCAAVSVYPKNSSEISSLMRVLLGSGVKYKVVGGMTNLLPCDGIFDGVLVRMTGIKELEFTENNTVLVGSGVPTSTFVKKAAERGIGGFEELSGIPGTVGGALYGNSGAHGVSISDFVVAVLAYDIRRNTMVELRRDEINYGYRTSLFKNDKANFIILMATLQGVERKKEEIFEKIKAFSTQRRARQPLEKPSLGSIFKHPFGDFAPRLIESLSLKGEACGGASVSKKHAGFIVNDGKATSHDVLALIERIKNRVFSEYGILLEEEIDIM